MKKKEEKSDAQKNHDLLVNSLKEEHSDTYLFEHNYNLDIEKFLEMAKYFPQIYWQFVLRGLILNLVLSSIIAITSQNIYIVLVFFIIYQIYLVIYYKVRLNYFLEKEFKRLLKIQYNDTEIHIEFYNDYLIKKGKTSARKIKYSEINKCIETESYFYLMDTIKNTAVFIEKEQCDLELINFIKKEFKNLEIETTNKKRNLNKKNKLNPNFISKCMTALFILTIASIWLAAFSFTIINEKNPHIFINQFKNLWVFYCWLPIPITSIILGFKFNKNNFKCTKNIVAGFIVGIIFIIFGSFSFIPSYSEDYEKIYKYEEIINVKLPKKGELTLENLEQCFNSEKTECTRINAYFPDEDTTKLVKSIKNNSNWFLSTEIKSTLKLLIPLDFYIDEDTYFSIYNKSTNQYNTLPEKSGNYEIYVMGYNISKKHLEIYKFNYIFK